jgi:hypothetical protein
MDWRYASHVTQHWAPPTPRNILHPPTVGARVALPPASETRGPPSHHRAVNWVHRVAVVALGLSLPALASAQRPALDLTDFLTHIIGLSDDELHAVARNEPVIRLLPTADDRDVAVFGIIATTAPLDSVTAWLSAFPGAASGPQRTLGLLGDSISPEDFSGVVLSARDAHGLRNCRVGSCDFKLAAEDMARAITLLHGTDDSVQATHFARARLAAIASAYRARGNDAMPTYDDYGTKSVRGAAAFEAAVSDGPFFRFAPELREYLLNYPRVQFAGARDALYWTHDAVPGVRSTTTLEHRVVYAPADVSGVVVAATKQIVADHYLDATLEMIAAVDRPAADERGTYLMLLRRYRFDHMPKALFFSLRSRVTGKLRERAKSDLLRWRNDLAPRKTQ